MRYRRLSNPTFAAFTDDPKSGVPINGVYHLNPALTINGQTVYPDFRYNACCATTSSWKPWGYGGSGGNLIIAGAGDLPSCSVGSPLLGRLDDSVKFNSGSNSATRGKFYKSPNTSFGNIGTEDFVIEMVATLPRETVTTNQVYFEKRTAGPGFFMQPVANPSFIYYFQGAGGASSTTMGTLAYGCWYHLLIFFDASGFVQGYVNGSAVGAAQATNIGSLTNTNPFYIGTGLTETSTLKANIAYLAMWKKTSWLDTHLQATVALERFNRLIGVYPQIARGTATPTSQTRATAAHIDKVETNGTRRLYQVGSGWLRLCSRNDAQGRNIKGYLGEVASTNYIQHSENLGTWWGKSNITTPSGSVVLPNGVISTTATLHEDATAANSHILGSPSVTVVNGAKWVYSAFVKAANRQYIYMSQDGVPGPNTNCTFAVFGTGSVLNPLFTNDAGIENWGNGWFRCWFSMTFTSGGSALWRFYLISGSGLQTSFDGLDQDSVYITGVQLEAGVDTPTSYIYASGSTATRNADVLYYNGADGNIGGLGSGKQGCATLSVLNVPITSSFVSTASNYWTLDDGTVNNHITAFNSLTNLNTVTRFRIRVGGVDQVVALGTGSINDNQITKLRYEWKTDFARLSVDKIYEAGSGNPDTSCLIPTGLNRIEICSIAGIQQTANSIISNFKLYKKPSNTK